jgi:hypothetical protein
MIAAIQTPFRHFWHQLATWRESLRSRDAQVVCPADSWPFRPRYTEGHCPLCGWEPPGAIVRLPLSRRIDSFGWMVITLLGLSLLMLVLVVVLYTRT